VQFFNQLCHTFHHVFTTKTPELKSTFSQNYPQKPKQNNKRVLGRHAQFFLQKSSHQNHYPTRSAAEVVAQPV
jgi:hypothetical protein